MTPPVRPSLVYLVPSMDVVAPGTVTDLVLVGSNGTDDALFATNALPGDNGFTDGVPHSYEFRSAAAPIATEGDWTAAAATSWVNTPSGLPGGYSEMYLTDQSAGTRYYHVRFTDLAGNVGGISNGVQVVLT